MLPHTNDSYKIFLKDYTVTLNDAQAAGGERPTVRVMTCPKLLQEYKGGLWDDYHCVWRVALNDPVWNVPEFFLGACAGADQADAFWRFHDIIFR